MTTYRTGNHWDITIVREGEASHTWRPFNVGNTVCAEVGCRLSEVEHPGLVAVVVNGDQALAERICALLNGEERPGPLEQAVRDMPEEDFVKFRAAFRRALDEDAPSRPLSAPESAEQAPVGGSGRPEPQRRSQAAGYAPPPSVGPGCICNDPPPTVDKPKNGTASRPPGWACPRHGTVI